MKRVQIILMFAVLLLSMASIAGAQSKTITGDEMVIKGTVEAIDVQAKVLTVKDSKGKFVTVDVPAKTERFSEVKVGDPITVRYIDNVTVRLKAPGEKDIDTAEAAKTPAAGGGPAGTMAKQRAITATIQELDPKVPSITFVGPNGWKYSRKVADKKAIEKVKVGDKVDIIWTEAVMIEVGPAKK
jgi:Cu/Ag efflux protein CusF